MKVEAREKEALFPAYAGVIPNVCGLSSEARTFPRIRGGDPVGVHSLRKVYAFSPHTRG